VLATSFKPSNHTDSPSEIRGGAGAPGFRFTTGPLGIPGIEGGGANDDLTTYGAGLLLGDGGYVVLGCAPPAKQKEFEQKFTQALSSLERDAAE
jgi:hypothetical protein